MASRDDIAMEITPEVLLKAYECGIFPMAESAEDPALYWIEPQHRGIMPLDAVRLSRRLLRTVKSDHFEVRVDRDFHAVIDGCAASRPGRRTTWINTRIRQLYKALFDAGHCHTVEARLDGRLVGGLYGVSLRGAFFGESMFSFETDASKVALMHLVARLKYGGFTLLDTQFVTDHLRQFGAVEVDRDAFHELLQVAMGVTADFHRLPRYTTGEEVVSILNGHRAGSPGGSAV
jgi:leucyl/phenylalanyl-tRNA--protein transferase